jgi:hypothetical protein
VQMVRGSFADSIIRIGFGGITKSSLAQGRWHHGEEGRVGVVTCCRGQKAEWAWSRVAGIRRH